MVPDYFPSIFGPDEASPLDAEASRAGLATLAAEINAAAQAAGQPTKTVDEVGWREVVGEAGSFCFCGRARALGHGCRRHVIAYPPHSTPFINPQPTL